MGISDVSRKVIYQSLVVVGGLLSAAMVLRFLLAGWVVGAAMMVVPMMFCIYAAEKERRGDWW